MFFSHFADFVEARVSDIAAKDADVCPEGKEYPKGLGISGLIAVFTSHGLDLRKIFFKITLHKTESKITATITTKPIFLVLGIKIKTSARITHAIEKFPRLVTNRIASSKKGVLKC